jgi:hypothetical protein
VLKPDRGLQCWIQIGGGPGWPQCSRRCRLGSKAFGHSTHRSGQRDGAERGKERDRIDLRYAATSSEESLDRLEISLSNSIEEHRLADLPT